MEFTAQYFMFIKWALFGITIFAVYDAFYKNRFKSTIKNILAFLLVVFALTAPIKMDLNTKQVTTRANTLIEQSKELPNKIINDSFNKSVNKHFEISEEDLK